VGQGVRAVVPAMMPPTMPGPTLSVILPRPLPCRLPRAVEPPGRHAASVCRAATA